MFFFRSSHIFGFIVVFFLSKYFDTNLNYSKLHTAALCAMRKAAAALGSLVVEIANIL